MKITPDMNDGNTRFVFGSNEAGQHIGGAAREAEMFWGAHTRACAARGWWIGD